MGGIPREKIDEVQAAADIVEVASEYVGRLKKSGSRYMALCPFHEESTPSFSLSPEKNLFYCFGCQKGGSIFTLVQEMEGVAFPEAVHQLADRFGVDLPQQGGGGEQRTQREPLYHALRFAARFFYHQLATTDHGAQARAYLREERGLDEETIKAFGLGYAPGRWDALVQAAGREQITPDVLEKAGLAIERGGSGGGHYDRYRGRVIFPIFSRVGHVLGLAGRVFDGAEGPAVGGDFDPPKYINSPETDVYHKKEVLYGLHQAKGALRKREEALLVEGYTDVIALAQAGVENVVATCGTALTAEQARLLGRYAERVVLLYDADEAGTRATLRGMDRVLEAGLGAYAVHLPEGHDPDDYVRSEGADAFRRLLRKRRRGVAAFHRAQAERDGTFGTPEGQTRTMRAVAASLALVPDDMARENQIRAASDALDMYEELLRKAVEKARSGQQRRQQRRRAPRPARPGPGEATEDSESARQAEAEQPATPLPQERNLLRLLLEHGRPMVELILGNMALTEFTDGPPRELAGRFLEMYQADEVAPQRALEGEFGAAIQRLAASVLTDAYEPSENWRARDINVPRLNQETRKAAASSMRQLKLRRVDEALEEVKARQFRTAAGGQDEREVQKRIMSLQALRQKIQRGAFFDGGED